jgi:hypothetical protein
LQALANPPGSAISQVSRTEGSCMASLAGFWPRGMKPHGLFVIRRDCLRP